jgi:hypothetical protein
LGVLSRKIPFFVGVSTYHVVQPCRQPYIHLLPLPLLQVKTDMSQIQIEKPTLRNPPQTVPSHTQIVTMGKNGLLSKRKRNNTKVISNPTKPKKKTTKASKSNSSIKATIPSQAPTEKPKPKPKRETFKQTILAIVQTLDQPIGREELVELAIKRNKPASQRPQWVYHDIIRKLAKEEKILLDKKGAKRKNHTVFHL